MPMRRDYVAPAVPIGIIDQTGATAATGRRG